MDWPLILVVVAGYGAAATAEIEIREGVRVSAGSAMAPAVLVILGGSFGAMATLFVAAALGLEFLLRVALRVSLSRIVANAVLGLGGIVFLGWLESFQLLRLETDSVPVLLALTIGASVSYMAVDVLRVSRRGIYRVWDSYDTFRVLLPYEAAMVSTACLIVLVYLLAGWLAFVFVFPPFLLTQVEFAKYAEARRTYEETVRALAELTERAGYVPRGRHEQVANLAVSVGRRLDLRGERLRLLRLTCYLYDVGLVAMADPDAASYHPSDSLLETSARVLEETGYLASQANLVRALAHPENEATPLEALILGASDRYLRDLAPSGVLPQGWAPDGYPEEVLVAIRAEVSASGAR